MTSNGCITSSERRCVVSVCCSHCEATIVPRRKEVTNGKWKKDHITLSICQACQLRLAKQEKKKLGKKYKF